MQKLSKNLTENLKLNTKQKRKQDALELAQLAYDMFKRRQLNESIEKDNSNGVEYEQTNTSDHNL